MIVSIAVLMMVEIVLRTFFGKSTFITEEYVGYMLAFAIIFGLSDAVHKGAMLRITILYDILSVRTRRWLDVFNMSATVVAVFLLIYNFCKFSFRQFELGSVSSSIAETPIWIPASIITFGLILLVIQLFCHLIKVLYNHAPDTAEISLVRGE